MVQKSTIMFFLREIALKGIMHDQIYSMWKKKYVHQMQFVLHIKKYDFVIFIKWIFWGVCLSSRSNLKSGSDW